MKASTAQYYKCVGLMQTVVSMTIGGSLCCLHQPGSAMWFWTFFLMCMFWDWFFGLAGDCVSLSVSFECMSFFCLNCYLLSANDHCSSRILESQESQYEVSLTRSLKRASFVKFLYMVWSRFHSWQSEQQEEVIADSTL